MRISAIIALCLLLTAVAGQSARADLVTNGSFATGDFTGWSLSDGSIIIDSSFAAPSDTHDAAFSGNGILSQNLATTAGTSYRLSFSVLDDSGLFSDTFAVSLGSFTADISGYDASNYLSAVYTVPAADILGADTLSFQGVSAAGDWHLDDVSVTSSPVPEPASGSLLVASLALGAMLTGRRRGVLPPACSN